MSRTIEIRSGISIKNLLQDFKEQLFINCHKTKRETYATQKN